MPSETAEQLHQRITRLAVEDAREARNFVAELLDANHPAFDSMLSRLAAPGEGRPRQVIAAVARTRVDKARLVPHLMKWAEAEVDEFTREAINAALENVDRTNLRPNHVADLPDFVDTYRHIADRLCHKIRNGMSPVLSRVRKLQAAARKISDARARAELLTIAEEVHDSFRQLSQLVEFDVTDEYFRYRPIRLPDWLEAMNRRYAAALEPIDLTIRESGDSSPAVIRANDQLLDIIFWNLWNNAAQAVHTTALDGTPCQVTIHIARDGANRVGLLVADNGPGIPVGVAEDAFRLAVSTRGEGRGRGLLEVQDAVRRLHGATRLVMSPGGEHRVFISLPVEGS